MNYEKIGKFIARKRKEQNLTQKDLGGRLNLTDRAISRWERGIGCPDISLLESLASILDVSILELLHGEEINDKTNENEVVINILNKNHKITKIWKIITLILLNSILLISLLSLIYLFIIPKQIEKNPNKIMYSIINGSMEPTLKVYDAIIVRKIDIQKIRIGDIITFVSNADMSNGLVLTHRVVGIKSDKVTGEIYLETQGDNNPTKDNSFVKSTNLIGVLDKRIPLLGQFLPIRVNSTIIELCIFLSIVSIITLDIIQIKNFKNNL